jgi:hypothetical protein
MSKKWMKQFKAFVENNDEKKEPQRGSFFLIE